jgi:hypothetical protein
LNQALAAIRFTVSETAKFSPYFLVYNRDVVLPVDNILRPRRKYLGDEHHQVVLEIQHKSFLQLHKNLEKAKKRQDKYANRGAVPLNFQIGDAVYLRNHTPKGKLDRKWFPFYRIISQTSPVPFVIKNQLDGSTRKTHANDIRLADVEQWDVPQDRLPCTLRQARYAEPPPQDETPFDEESKKEDLNGPDDRFREERTDSSDEDNVPLAELQKRSRHREDRLRDSGEVSPHADPLVEDESECDILKNEPPLDTDEEMNVDEVVTRQKALRRERSRLKDTI